MAHAYSHLLQSVTHMSKDRCCCQIAFRIGIDADAQDQPQPALKGSTMALLPYLPGIPEVTLEWYRVRDLTLDRLLMLPLLRVCCRSTASLHTC